MAHEPSPSSTDVNDVWSYTSTSPYAYVASITKPFFIFTENDNLKNKISSRVKNAALEPARCLMVQFTHSRSCLPLTFRHMTQLPRAAIGLMH
jgi:hypothetical protein